MQGLMPAPLVEPGAVLDVLNPVDWSAPLNRGLLNWHLVLPHILGDVTWRNLVRPAHATLAGTEPRSVTQGWSPTMRRGGFGEVRFNGTSSISSLASSTVYDFAQTTFTVSCWFRAAVGTGGTLVSRRLLAAAEGSWFVRTETAGTATARLSNSLGNQVCQRVSVGTTLANGAWHHLVCVFTTHSTTTAFNDMVLYVDGRLDQGTRTGGSGGYAAPPRDVTFGFTPPSADPLSGAMDDVRIYTRGLSAREVQALYQASRTGYQRELRWLAPPLLFVTSAGTVRPLSAALVGTSTTPGSSAVLTRRLQAVLSSATTTPVSLAVLTRRLISTLVGMSATLASSATVARRLLSNLPGQSVTSPVAPVQQRRLTASLSGLSSTPSSPAVVGRRLSAQLQGSSVTPAILGTLTRRLTAQIQGMSVTPASPASLTRRLTVQIQASSITSPPQAILTRRLTASVVGSSVTPAATVQLPGQVVLTTSLTAASTTSTIAAPLVQRRVSAQLQGSSVTPAILGTLTRRLVATLAGSSTTFPSTVVVSAAVTFTAALHGLSATAASTVTLAQALVTHLAGLSATAAAQVALRRPFQAALDGVSTTPPALLLPTAGVVAFTASLQGSSQTSSATLIIMPTVRVGTVPPGGRIGTVPVGGVRVGTVPPVGVRVGTVKADGA